MIRFSRTQENSENRGADDEQTQTTPAFAGSHHARGQARSASRTAG
jgi:hypothetical protein